MLYVGETEVRREELVLDGNSPMPVLQVPSQVKAKAHLQQPCNVVEWFGLFCSQIHYIQNTPQVAAKPGYLNGRLRPPRQPQPSTQLQVEAFSLFNLHAVTAKKLPTTF